VNPGRGAADGLVGGTLPAEEALEPGPLRRLATMGMLAIIAMLLMYLFAAKQVTDTETPRIAALTHDVLQRNLVKGSRTSLQLLSRAGAAERHYELRIHPAPRLADDGAGVQTLLASAAQVVLEELGTARGQTTVTCVAVLPDAETRVTYDHRMQTIPEPARDSAPPSEDAR